MQASQAHRKGARLALLSGLAVAFIGFIALGVWQLERLAWKQDLIERVESRVRAPAVAPPETLTWTSFAAQPEAKRYEYLRIEVTGRYLSGVDTRVQAVTAIGAGYWLLTPLQRADGSIVLINRGFVAPEWTPSAVRDAAATPEVRVAGLLRLSEPSGAFLRSNAPADGRWYSRDVQAIAAARGLQRVAPYFIDADFIDADAADGAGSRRVGSTGVGSAEAGSAGYVDDRSGVLAPVAGLTVVRFRNHHLQYALTWFALALMVVAAVWRVLRDDRRLA
jgi:surfeit locus 1 family protein